MQEILKVMQNGGESVQNNAQASPADANLSVNTAETMQDLESMEAQDTEIITQSSSTNIIDLTNTTETEVTENTEECSVISVAKNPRKKPILRRELYKPRTPDAKFSNKNKTEQI